jgi:hypothetical protein
MNKKSPYIYLDLDETLIYSRFCSDYKPMNVPEGAFSFKMKGNWYLTQLRPCALELIEFCRKVSTVKILTAATSRYAKTISDHFGFGFEEDDIVDRYQYCKFVHDGWSGYAGGARETCVALEPVGHINSILVDNQEADLPNARIKREWLGISTDRYIQFPEWQGGEEGPWFEDEFEKIKTLIAVLVSEVVSYETPKKEE